MLTCLWIGAATVAGAAIELKSDQWVGTLVAVLVVMVAWLVFAQHRLAKNQVRIAELVQEILSEQRKTGRPEDAP